MQSQVFFIILVYFFDVSEIKQQTFFHLKQKLKTRLNIWNVPERNSLKYLLNFPETVNTISLNVKLILSSSLL